MGTGTQPMLRLLRHLVLWQPDVGEINRLRQVLNNPMSVSALNRFSVITRPLLVLAQCQPAVVALAIVADLRSLSIDSIVKTGKRRQREDEVHFTIADGRHATIRSIDDCCLRFIFVLIRQELVAEHLRIVHHRLLFMASGRKRSV